MNMKNIAYIAAGCLLLSANLLSGCDSFLDEAPRGKAIATSVNEYNGMFNTTLFMNLSLSHDYYAFWRSDDLIFTPDCYSQLDMNTFYGSSIKNAFQYKQEVYRGDQESSEWVEPYKQIYVFNSIVNGVMSATGSEKEKLYLQSEARVSRAYMHFLLAQWFALPYDESYAETELTVPLVTEAETSVMNYRRATMKEMYDFITTEMEESCPNLEDRVDHRMRVYKPTGYGLMGKVYFLMGKYDKALTALRTAYELLPKSAAEVYLLDYNELMRPYGYRELTADELYSDMDILPYLFRSSQVLWCKQTTMMNSYYFVYGDQITFYLNPEFYALYDEYDLRRNLICTVNREGTPLTYPYPGFLGNKINLGLNLPEVYLMLAECEARVGSEDNARQILADFRKYRVLPGHEEVPSSVTTKEDLIRFCVDELNREFMATGYRWYTVRRLWNDPLFQDMKPVTHFDGEQTFTLDESGLKTAIPETVLEWNESWRGQ